jgi:hypothetical protein
MMQAIELATGDDFLAKYNLSIDTSDVIEYMRKATRIWTLNDGDRPKDLGEYYHCADFMLKFKLITAEVITQRGFCYSFNIAEPSQLFRLEKCATSLPLHSHLDVFTCSVADVFNFPRTFEIREMIKKTKKLGVANNATYPWSTHDHTLGFHSEILLLPWRIDKFESHPSYSFFGVNYQFHDPLELPSNSNPRFVSHVGSSLIFLVEAELKQLGDTLLNYGLERFDASKDFLESDV